MARSETELAPPSWMPPGMNPRRVQFVLVGVLLTMTLALLDQNIVSTAAWAISRDLDPVHGLDRLPWLVTAYLLASTATQPLYGRMCDVYGPKRVFLFAIGVFLAGSALCGLAQNLDQLIVLRFVQGLGGGGLMSVAIVIAGTLAPPKERAQKAGLGGIMIALGTVLGPLVGGYITQNWSWRWIFYVNIPLGVAAFVIVALALRLPERHVPHSIDVVGAGLIAAATAAILLVTEEGGDEYAWTSWQIIGLAVVGLGLLAAFGRRQVRTPEPLFPLSLLRNPVFRIASPMIFVSGVAMVGSIVYVVLYLQLVQAVSPVRAGLHLIPMAVGLVITSFASGQMIMKTGRYRRYLVASFASAAAGTGLLALLGPGSSVLTLNGGLFLLGAGLGPTMSLTLLAVQNGVPIGQIGTASSATTFCRTMGSAVGTAVLGVILTDRFHHELAGTGVTGKPTAAMLATLPADVRDSVLTAFVDGTHLVFLVATGLLIGAFALAAVIPEVPIEFWDEDDAPSTPAPADLKADIGRSQI